MNDEAWRRVARPSARTVDEATDAGVRPAFERLLAAHDTGAAFVIAQLGLSLDGRIATPSGDSCYINGQDALCHLHRIRALVDAVIVGAGTVRADDPQLTVRHCAGRHPARVVIDPSGTIPPTARVWADTDNAPRIVFGGAPDLPDGVERLPAPPGGLTADRILGALADMGLVRVLVEGGADTLGRFLAEDVIDCLHLLYGRVIIGSGKPGLSLPPVAALSDALRPETTTHIFPDGDFLVACDLKPAGD